MKKCCNNCEHEKRCINSKHGIAWDKETDYCSYFEPKKKDSWEEYVSWKQGETWVKEKTDKYARNWEMLEYIKGKMGTKQLLNYLVQWNEITAENLEDIIKGGL